MVSACVSVKKNLDDDQKKWVEMEMLGATRRAKNTSYVPSLNRVFPHLCLLIRPHLLMSIIFTDLHKSSHET